MSPLQRKTHGWEEQRSEQLLFEGKNGLQDLVKRRFVEAGSRESWKKIQEKGRFSKLWDQSSLENCSLGISKWDGMGHKMVLRWLRFAFGLLHTAVTLRNHPHGATARLLGPPERWHGCARRKWRRRGGQEQQTGAVEKSQRESSQIPTSLPPSAPVHQGWPSSSVTYRCHQLRRRCLGPGG